MTYLTPASFRVASLDPACEGLDLTDDQANDQRLTSAIASVSQRIDRETDDHFESASATYDISVRQSSPQLMLPARCTAVSTVKTRDHTGALTPQNAASYRLISSLDSTGANRVGSLDVLELIPLGLGLSGPDIWWGSQWPYWWQWPKGPQIIQVVGTFGWTVTPGDIKRATALYVWDRFFRQAGDLGRVKAFTRGDIRVEQADGVPEADAIIEDYNRLGKVPIW